MRFTLTLDSPAQQVRQVDLLSATHFYTVLQWTEMVELDEINLEGTVKAPKHCAKLSRLNRNYNDKI